MKKRRVSIALAALVCLAACKKSEPLQPLIDRAGQLSRFGLTSSSPAASFVTVDFGGLICHVTTGNSPRAVLVQDTTGAMAHRGILFLPPSVDPQAVTSIFPHATCSTNGCIAPLDRNGLRLVGEDNGASINRLQTRPTGGMFDSTVPRLGSFIATLKDEVFLDVPAANSVMSSYFLLNGGSFDADVFGCKAKFENEADTEYRYFNSSASLHFTFNQNVKLEVISPTADWRPIPLGGGSIRLGIVNLGPRGASHINLFERLAKTLTKPIPQVINKGGCLHPLGGVPGCANTQWP